MMPRNIEMYYAPTPNYCIPHLAFFLCDQVASGMKSSSNTAYEIVSACF